MEKFRIDRQRSISISVSEIPRKPPPGCGSRGRGDLPGARARSTPRDLLFRLDPSRQPSRDLGGADVRRATRVARAAYSREAGALSLSAGASLPPSPLFSRRRCHKVTRSLGSARFTRAGVRTVRSISRSVGRSRFPPTGKYLWSRSAIARLRCTQ